MKIYNISRIINSPASSTLKGDGYAPINSQPVAEAVGDRRQAARGAGLEGAAVVGSGPGFQLAGISRSATLYKSAKEPFV